MKSDERKNHWEKIYSTKEDGEMSWFQPSPGTSLDFVKRFHLPKSAGIIDIGGGDSRLADALLDMGYEDITVLDISATALERAKQRLGKRAEKIKWLVADIMAFKPSTKYDFWHDRATFHFLTREREVEKYITVAQQAINPDGIMVLGTFSEQGPEKCSGLEIKQYSEISMTDRLKKFFKKIRCITVSHRTPFNTIQDFIFCSFRKLKIT